MVLKSLILLCLLLSILEIVTGLDCYRCSTEKQGDACSIPKEENVDVIQCKDEELCVLLKVVNSKGSSYVRNCGSISFCLQMKKMGYDMRQCIACNQNLCNG